MAEMFLEPLSPGTLWAGLPSEARSLSGAARRAHLPWGPSQAPVGQGGAGSFHAGFVVRVVIRVFVPARDGLTLNTHPGITFWAWNRSLFIRPWSLARSVVSPAC